jgi:predicted DNA-binding transcriptional regulator AlpA
MMRNTLLRTAKSMPLTIEGVEFFTTTEVTKMVGVSRQTLWRWRAEGDVPLGRRYRRKSVVFTRTEVDEIVAFANRIEPIAVEGRSLDAGRLTDSQEAM